MDALTLWMLVGFLFAGYAVIANDSVQTLGTWIASNNEKFNWKMGSLISSYTFVVGTQTEVTSLWMFEQYRLKKFIWMRPNFIIN